MCWGIMNNSSGSLALTAALLVLLAAAAGTGGVPADLASRAGRH